MKTFFPTSIVIPMRNSSSTILQTLESIKKQRYPILEIIVVDNASTDNSVLLVKNFAGKHKRMNIKLLKNKTNLRVARSFSRGIRATKTAYVILMHSDCRLISPWEFGKLLKPFEEDKDVFATYGRVLQLLETWQKYAFWEKFLFAYQAGKSSTGLVGKIDCIKKSAYFKIGGHDTEGYYRYGGEDADLHAKFKKIGKTSETNATVEHLHYIYLDFSFTDLLKKKKETAGAYGVLLGKYGFRNGFKGLITFLLKPMLAIGLLIPGLDVLAFFLVCIFIVKYYFRMFITPEVRSDPRIFLVPFASIFLLYWEAFWTAEGFYHDRKSFS